MMSGPSASLWCIAVMVAFADASRLSPSTIRVNSPYRSVMWCGCHGVVPRRSARTGTASSPPISSTTRGVASGAGTASQANHSTWIAAIPAA